MVSSRVGGEEASNGATSARWMRLGLDPRYARPMGRGSENDVVVEAWNTVLFEKFSRFKHLLIDGLAAHSDAALERSHYAPGERVVDIGCGFGDSTRRIAQRVGPAGEAVGVDCASNFIE